MTVETSEVWGSSPWRFVGYSWDATLGVPRKKVSIMGYGGPEQPRLRPVEVVPLSGSGGSGFLLSDPQRVATQPVVLSPGALLVLRFTDGEHTLRQIQADIARSTGRILPFEQIENLLEALDAQLYLDSPRFHAAHEAMREQYFASPTRRPALAGVSYPDGAVELRKFIDSLFAAGGRPAHADSVSPREEVLALIAPHIDFRRGGAAFACAYRALAEGSKADVFVILGIAHSGDGKPYTLTDKDFETPLGTVPTEKTMVARLEQQAPPEAFGDEYVQRSEHSIELQVVLLRYLYPDRAISIVPILCGSFREALAENRPPIERSEVAAFITALRSAIDEADKRVCIISAADLAHIGGRFGDQVSADEQLLRWVELEDRAMLETVAALDSRAFFRSLQKDCDRRHVCGFPAIYTMLALFERDRTTAPTSGTILTYEQSSEPETGSAVTFAAMKFS